MTRLLMWTAALVVAATPALAQQASPDASAVAPAAPVAPAKPKKVCRTFQVTGRRISETECYTAAQWAAYDRAENEAANKFVADSNRANAGATMGGGAGGSLSTGSVFGIGPQ